jgi:hypothetical protein
MTDASRAEPAARTPDRAAVRRRPRAAVRHLRLCVGNLCAGNLRLDNLSEAHLPRADGFDAVISPFGTMSIAP